MSPFVRSSALAPAMGVWQKSLFPCRNHAWTLSHTKAPYQTAYPLARESRLAHDTTAKPRRGFLRQFCFDARRAAPSKQPILRSLKPQTPTTAAAGRVPRPAAFFATASAAPVRATMPVHPSARAAASKILPHCRCLPRMHFSSTAPVRPCARAAAQTPPDKQKAAKETPLAAFFLHTIPCVSRLSPVWIRHCAAARTSCRRCPP